MPQLGVLLAGRGAMAGARVREALAGVGLSGLIGMVGQAGQRGQGVGAIRP